MIYLRCLPCSPQNPSVIDQSVIRQSYDVQSRNVHPPLTLLLSLSSPALSTPAISPLPDDEGEPHG